MILSSIYNHCFVKIVVTAFKQPMLLPDKFLPGSEQAVLRIPNKFGRDKLLPDSEQDNGII